jgi:hypothetical protein
MMPGREWLSPLDWISPLKIIEYYVLTPDRGCDEAEKQLYLAVMKGEVRSALNGRELGPEWRNQISHMKFDERPFTLPPDLRLSVEDAKRIWGVPK